MKGFMAVLMMTVVLFGNGGHKGTSNKGIQDKPAVLTEQDFFDLTRARLGFINDQAEFFVQTIAQDGEIDLNEQKMLFDLRFQFYEIKKDANLILKKYYRSLRRVDVAFNSHADFIVRALTAKSFWIKDNDDRVKKYYKAMFGIKINRVQKGLTVLAWMVLLVGMILLLLGGFRALYNIRLLFQDSFLTKDSRSIMAGLIIGFFSGGAGLVFLIGAGIILWVLV